MPPIRELLSNEAALRAVVAATPPRVLARRINASLAGSLDLVDDVLRVVFRLYVETWGLAHALEFQQELKR